MCRIHIQTVREIRREENVMLENAVPVSFEFGGFMQWMLDDFPEQWTPETTDGPLSAQQILNSFMQMLAASPQPTANLGLTLLPPNEGLNAATQQLHLQTSSSLPNQSEGGNHEPSDQPETGTGEFLHQVHPMMGSPFMPQAGGEHSQQSHASINVPSQQPQVGTAGLFQPGVIYLPEPGFPPLPVGFGGFSQASETVGEVPLSQPSTMESHTLPPDIGGFIQHPQTGTNPPSQPSPPSFTPGAGSTSQVIQQIQETAIELILGGGAPYLSFTSTNGLFEILTSGPPQQPAANTGGNLPLFGLGAFLQPHLNPGNLFHQIHENIQGTFVHYHPGTGGLVQQPQPSTNGTSQHLHGTINGTVHSPGSLVGFSPQLQASPSGPSQSLVGFSPQLQASPSGPSQSLVGFSPQLQASPSGPSQSPVGFPPQLQASPSGPSQQSLVYNNASTQHPHAYVSGFSSQSHLGTNVLSFPPHAGMVGPSQSLTAGSHGSFQQSQADASEHVPYSSTGMFIAPPLVGSGGIQDQAGMGSSFQQPVNTGTLPHQSQISTVGLSQHPQAGSSEISQQPPENIQDFQTDSDKLSQTNTDGLS